MAAAAHNDVLMLLVDSVTVIVRYMAVNFRPAANPQTDTVRREILEQMRLRDAVVAQKQLDRFFDIVEAEFRRAEKTRKKTSVTGNSSSNSAGCRCAELDRNAEIVAHDRCGRRHRLFNRRSSRRRRSFRRLDWRNVSALDQAGQRPRVKATVFFRAHHRFLDLFVACAPASQARVPVISVRAISRRSQKRVPASRIHAGSSEEPQKTELHRLRRAARDCRAIPHA